MAEIGKRIKAKREELNITQEELASRLGYKSKTSIAKIENGTNDIAQSKVLEFAKALNTTSAYLMGLQNDEKDISNDLNSMLSKLRKGEDGPAVFDGEAIPEYITELFADQLELMILWLKKMNKDKYNPNKNKK